MTCEAGRDHSILVLMLFRIGARLFGLLVAIRAARSFTGLELKAIWRIAYRHNPKVAVASRCALCEKASSKSLIPGFGKTPGLSALSLLEIFVSFSVAHKAAHRSFEKLSGEIVQLREQHEENPSPSAHRSSRAFPYRRDDNQHIRILRCSF